MSVIRVLIIALLSFLAACAIGDSGRYITSQDTAWIEKSRTTRDQVITKFGEPAFTGTYKEVGEYAVYVIPAKSRLPLEPTQAGPLPQVHRPPKERTVPSEMSDDQFWVIYNAKGIVHDFGFGTSPN